MAQKHCALQTQASMSTMADSPPMDSSTKFDPVDTFPTGAPNSQAAPVSVFSHLPKVNEVPVPSMNALLSDKSGGAQA